MWGLKEMGGADSLTPWSWASLGMVTGRTALACILSEDEKSHPWSLGSQPSWVLKGQDPSGCLWHDWEYGILNEDTRGPGQLSLHEIWDLEHGRCQPDCY